MTRILVADDNDINCRLFGWQLDTLGFSCDVARSGQSALAACREQAYDLVFLDLNLGDMDGYQVARELRAKDPASGRRTAIIAATAHTGESVVERCLAAGMDDFAEKPVMLAPLARLLVRWGAPDHGATSTDAQEAHLADAAVAWLRALETRIGEPRLARALAHEYLDRAAAHVRRMRAALERGTGPALALERFAWQRSSTGIGALRLARAIADAADTSESLDQLVALLEETRSAIVSRFP